MEVTQIQFHSGLDIVGANIVSLTCGNYRIVTDFGALIGQTEELSEDIQQTHQLYSQQKLPQIEGIYRGDFDFSFREEGIETLILISHLHLDHIGSLGHLAPEVPIMMSQESYEFYQHLRKNALLPNYPVNFMGAEYEELIEFGPFEIYFVPSDHDTRGVSSIFIQTPDLKIIHSGDLRMSGYKPERVFEMVQKANEFNPDILLLEGTAFNNFGENPTENDLALEELVERINCSSEIALHNQLVALIKKHSDQLLAFNGYPQNIDRLIHLGQSLLLLNRKLILQDNLYQLVKEYADPALFTPMSRVNITDIQAEPEAYCIQVDEVTYPQIYQISEGTLLHSNGSPLGSYMEGYDEYIRGFKEHHWQIYLVETSGHAKQEDLLAIAYTIDANYTVGWHTANATEYIKALANHGVLTWVPELGQTYTLYDLKNKGEFYG